MKKVEADDEKQPEEETMVIWPDRGWFVATAKGLDGESLLYSSAIAYSRALATA